MTGDNGPAKNIDQIMLELINEAGGAEVKRTVAGRRDGIQREGTRRYEEVWVGWQLINSQRRHQSRLRNIDGRMFVLFERANLV